MQSGIKPWVLFSSPILSKYKAKLEELNLSIDSLE